jgi:phosphohistidine swiveling domain-containing protein
MSDWNPAEIIGRTPKVLATSLYRALFTDEVWSLARGVMGYQTPKGPLMLDILGQPYIDVRKSMNSFLPKNLDGDISEKLVSEWIEHLTLFPELHDKVEFDVGITCWTFGFEDLLERSAKTLTGVERNTYTKEMKRLTLELMVPGPENTLEVAKTKLEELSNLSIDDKSIPELIAECKDLGSLPFAICARHAFVARTILQSLVELEIMSVKEFDKLLREATSVTSDFIFDFRRVGTGNLSKEAFFQKYGHLRPGTYEITSARYDQFDWTFENDSLPDGNQQVVVEGMIGLRDETLASMKSLMKQFGISSLNASELIEYCINSIAAREEAKFTFTKHVSGILEKAAAAGNKHGLSREEISHLSLFDVVRLESDSMRDDEVTILQSQIELHKFNHQVSRAARLPEVIHSESAAYVIPFQVSKPNFVGKQKVSGPLKEVVSGEKKPTLTGAIVMIENADPGFDWIFAEGILGLVTRYGGVNSHMAIRCAELSITAAIGCGEQLFESMRLENLVEIDPQAGIISGIS